MWNGRWGGLCEDGRGKKSTPQQNYSTVTECFGYGVLNKPKSFIRNEIDILQILTELKDKC
jgi:hypothetical protein